MTDLVCQYVHCTPPVPIRLELTYSSLVEVIADAPYVPYTYGGETVVCALISQIMTAKIYNNTTSGVNI